MTQDISIHTLEGELLEHAVLTPKQMCSMNFAREEFNRLVQNLLPIIEPLRRNGDEAAINIDRHIEQVRIFSRNFCWQYRHVGASYGVVGKRPGIDDKPAR